MFDMLTGYLNQAQYFAQQNPWVWLVVAALLYFFVVRPMMNRGGSNVAVEDESVGYDEETAEGFSGGQTFEEQ